MRNLISLPQRTSNQNPSATNEPAVHGRSTSFSKARICWANGSHIFWRYVVSVSNNGTLTSSMDLSVRNPLYDG